jgi:hypothetical protein
MAPRPNDRASHVLALIVLGGLANGCSVAFVTPAAPPSRRECTSSRVAPVIDTVVGAYEIFRTGYALTAPESVYEKLGVPRELDVAVGATLAAGFVGSAIYGYVKTAECEAWEETPVDDTFP